MQADRNINTENIKVTRHTIVTSDNLEAVTNRLVEVRHPCILALGCSNKGWDSKDLTNHETNEIRTKLKRILLKECIQDGVPLMALTEGACILKGAITYYGKMSIQLLLMQARQQGLPIFSHADFKYTIDCIPKLISMQKEYEEMLWEARSSVSTKTMEDELISFSKSEVYSSEEYADFPPNLLVPSNTFLVSGAIGTLYFNDIGRNDATIAYDSHFRISRDDTKIGIEFKDKFSNSIKKTKTPYAKYPHAMIRIKFLRKGMQEYYGSQIKQLNYNDDLEIEQYLVQQSTEIDEEVEARRKKVSNGFDKKLLEVTNTTEETYDVEN